MFAHADPPQWSPLDWRGIHFPNRLGIAGGVDKNAENIKAWWSLGAGFVEAGTITPLPQKGNTPPVLDRDVDNYALWNRLGFPSEGVRKVRKRLEDIKRPFGAPVFANIGKNATTPLDQAHSDYIHLLVELKGLVDAFVINISSPNTKGLRELLKPERLRDFLGPIMDSLPADHEPVLLKLSPDLEDDELERVLSISVDLGIDGWILTNTSQGLREGLNFPKEGGVSGKPLANLSKEFLQKSLRLLGAKRKDKLVVSVGGVMSPEDVQERLDLGADLVQVYSALIFEGPWFFRKVANKQCQLT
ncbi:MAG: quinone-dependent dihydroorotate dehydrogenase [Bdellovibrionales bacterium]